MKRLHCLAAAAVGLSISAATAGGPVASGPAAAARPEAAATVTLGDLGGETGNETPVVRGQSTELPGSHVTDSVVMGDGWQGGVPCADGSCGSGDCQSCGDGSGGHGRQHHVSGWLKGQSDLYRNRNRRNSGAMAGYLRAKFGYFCPTGNCGRGVPLYGKYNIHYAQNPGHVDGRDGELYQAPGYGTPVTVPLAPNVRHAYNYSWGVPSSRLTPLRQATVVAPPVDVVHGPRWK